MTQLQYLHYSVQYQKNNKNTEDALISPLSVRELEVLKLMVSGKSNTTMAEELIVSVHTAKAHVCSILRKMQVSDRVQASIKASKLGLVRINLI